MVDGVKGSREVEKARTRYFMRSYSIDVIMNIQNSSFSGKVLTLNRLVRIK